MDGQCGVGFGARVRARRRALGITQVALAAAIPVTRAAINQIETGRIRGRKSTRDRIEAFLSEREVGTRSVAAVSQWLRNAAR